MQKVCFLNIGNFANFACRKGLRLWNSLSQHRICVQLVAFTQNRDTVALVQKKTYVLCTKNVRRNTPATASSRQPQTTNTREPWPKLVDFATTISHSLLGQISCLRHRNPLQASAAGTHWTCFTSLACSCSFLWGLFKASVKLANFVSGSQRWFLGPLHLNSSCT
jgi:hypothetical protein